MISRQAARERASRFVDLTAVPDSFQWNVVNFLETLQPDEKIGKSELIREFLRCEELNQLMSLPQNLLSHVFRCCPQLVQRVVAEFHAGKTTVRPGRPCVITDENMAAIVAWLRERTANQDWISMREFKRRIVDVLEAQEVENYPTTQFYRDLLKRIDGGRYTTSFAQPLEEERFALTQQQVLQYFEQLRAADVENLDPNLILNCDETGFGASSSHRLKPTKVIIEKDSPVKPCVAYHTDRVFVSAIATITAAGEALKPGLIVRRATVDSDFEELPVGTDLHVYYTERAFVTRQVFSNYLREVCLTHIDSWRQKTGKRDARALIIFDGHSSHVSDMIRAVCAAKRVDLICLPPHSSHLLQPLDRLYFSRLKQFYAQLSVAPDLSGTSRALLRIIIAFEQSQSRYMICQSWAMTGVCPVVTSREVSGVSLKPERLEGEAALQHAPAPATRGRGERNLRPAWGILTEDEKMIYEAGQCPLCYGELPDGWTFQ